VENTANENGGERKSHLDNVIFFALINTLVFFDHFGSTYRFIVCRNDT